jgi:hypothetical protein
MNARTLKLSNDLSFPLSLVTASGVIYGGKGMGKSSLGIGVIPEELDRAGLKFSLIDPMGVGYGLQHGADRESKGIEVLIVGGKHGDIEIEPTSGAVVADLVVDEHVSTVIDISRHKNGKMWSKAEKIRFVADYCTRLYERQGEKTEPLLVIIDEAGRFCPQMIPHGSPELARCVGAIEMLVEEGRNVGVGCLLITQRSARMNKSVSELADYMIAFRTVGPNSVSAIMDWLGEHVEKVRHKDIVVKLRELPVGSALVVSPGYLRHEGIVRFRARHTFDSSATPKAGEIKRAPGAATKPDLVKYRKRMAETIEKAQLNDPSKLKQKLAAALAENVRLAKLKAAPALKPGKAPAPEKVTVTKVKVEIVRVPLLKESEIKRLEKVAEIISAGAGEAAIAFTETKKVLALNANLAQTVAALQKAPAPVVPARAPAPAAAPVRDARHAPSAPHARVPAPAGPMTAARGTLSTKSGKDRVLIALARRHPSRLTRAQLATLSGLSITSGHYTNILSELRTAGLADEDHAGFGLTSGGQDQCHQFLGIAQSVDEVRAMWQQNLGGTEWRLLDWLIRSEEANPERYWTRDEVAGGIGLSITSGHYTNMLSTLRRNGLLEEQGSNLRVTRSLMPETIAA